MIRSQTDIAPPHSLATQNPLTSAAPGLSNSSLLTTADEDHDLALALALSEEDPAAFLAMQSEFNDFYGLVPPPQTVLVRAYSDDGDDRMLAEIQPRFIVMFEPNQDFVRRIEVCLLFVACPFGVVLTVFALTTGLSKLEPGAGCKSVFHALSNELRRA